MKNIIEYISESKGTPALKRDGSHGKYEDPLVKKRESRPYRAEDLKSIKGEKICKDLLGDITVESNLYKIFKDLYVYDRKNIAYIISTIDDLVEGLLYGNGNSCFGIALNVYSSLESDSVKNYINNYFLHDKRMSKFLINSNESVKLDENKFYLVKSTGEKKTYNLFGIYFNKIGYKGYYELSKYLTENKEDIVYTIKKFCDFYSKLKEHKIKFSILDLEDE